MPFIEFYFPNAWDIRAGPDQSLVGSIHISPVGSRDPPPELSLLPAWVHICKKQGKRTEPRCEPQVLCYGMGCVHLSHRIKHLAQSLIIIIKVVGKCRPRVIWRTSLLWSGKAWWSYTIEFMESTSSLTTSLRCHFRAYLYWKEPCPHRHIFSVFYFLCVPIGWRELTVIWHLLW